jgi:uncharacterized protein YhbP (UPF0306 family)
MDNTQTEQIIRQYLPQVIHMTAASVGSKGKPWSWEVHYAFDDDLNVYWVSSTAARHSQELAKNPNISGTIVVQHFLNQMGRGVSFEGMAERIEAVDEGHPGFVAYTSRFPDRKQPLLDGYANNEPGARRLYKATVTDFYLADGIATGKLGKFHLLWGSAASMAGKVGE